MKIKIVGLSILILIPLMTTAQVPLNVPSNTQNTRFYSDIFNIERPALSVVGFDNGGDNSKGYGLKQTLEKLYSGSANSLMSDNFNEIVRISKLDFIDPLNPPAGEQRDAITLVNRNSNILQSRAFVALARYILHKNSITNQIPGATQNAPNYTTAISDLRSAFLEPEDWLLANSSHKDDQVKWTRTVGNYARALDKTRKVLETWRV